MMILMMGEIISMGNSLFSLSDDLKSVKLIRQTNQTPVGMVVVEHRWFTYCTYLDI